VAFPLHPDTPEEGLSLERLFAGRGIDLAEKAAEMKRVAAANGLAWGERTMTFNSRRAQEMGKWAEEMGKGHEYHAAAFRAYFVDGLNIAKPDVLAGLAASLGLDPDEARRVLAEGLYGRAVDQDWARCQALGITAVPTFVAGGRGVVGAQPYEALVRLIRAAQAG